MSSRGVRPIVTAVAGGVLLAGSTLSCAGTLEDPERFAIGGSPTLPAAVDGSSSVQRGSDPACEATVVALFPARCAAAGCHSAMDKTAGLDLQSPDVRARLTGAAATGGPGILLDPGGDPEKSILYLKLTPMPPFGAQMPLTGAKLDETALACVAQWISTPGGDADAGSPAEGGE
jgi:hypothetical protein